MNPEDLNLFDVLERDEPTWDDDNVLEPIRYEVQEMPFSGRVLARLNPLASGHVTERRPVPADLSDFRKVSR